MSLFKKPESRFWWTRFYVNGREYRLSTHEADRRRAASSAACLKQETIAAQHDTPQRGLGTLLELSKQDIADTVALIQQGRIKPVISRVFSLKDAVNAHRAFEAGEIVGRALLVV